MKYVFFIFLGGLMAFFSCKRNAPETIAQENFEFAAEQLTYALTQVEQAIAEESPQSKNLREERGLGPLVSPRSIDEDGALTMVTSRDWTSGFFPGELWFMYEYTRDPIWEVANFACIVS